MRAPSAGSMVPLLKEVNDALLALLESLGPDDWRKPTVHPTRDVKDLAAHLLDGSLRRLSFQRDGHFLPAPDMRSFEDLVAFVQQLNTEWMVAAKRLSPRLIVELMRRADEEVAALFASLDPDAPAPFAVSWAGDEWSPNWFDIAREYTEKWHHQQQIRDAVRRPGMTERRYLHPVLDTFVRGAPHAYRDIQAPEGTVVLLDIRGDAGGQWHLQRGIGQWELAPATAEAPAATLALDADAAWRLWTKGLAPDAARARAAVTGDAALTAPLFSMVTIMA